MNLNNISDKIQNCKNLYRIGYNNNSNGIRINICHIEKINPNCPYKKSYGQLYDIDFIFNNNISLFFDQEFLCLNNIMDEYDLNIIYSIIINIKSIKKLQIIYCNLNEKFYELFDKNSSIEYLNIYLTTNHYNHEQLYKFLKILYINNNESLKELHIPCFIESSMSYFSDDVLKCLRNISYYIKDENSNNFNNKYVKFVELIRKCKKLIKYTYINKLSICNGSGQNLIDKEINELLKVPIENREIYTKTKSANKNQ